MSKNNNKTQDHFKVGGAGHNGEDVLHEVNKSQYAQTHKAQEEALIPGSEQEGETPAPKGGPRGAGEATASSNSSKGDY